MSNIELTKHYLSQPKKDVKFKEPSYNNIINALNDNFEDWTWELADEKFALDNTIVCTTVTLYIPGKVLTGRSISKIKDYNINHLFALLDASGSLLDKNQVSNTPIQNNNQPQQNTNMTPEQIMSMINNQNEQQPINTAAEFHNYKENGMPADEVPFDKMTNNCIEEINQEITKPSTPPVDDEYTKPQDRYKGFSQKQIDDINAFKARNGIINDAMFNKWVMTWNSNLKNGKKDITPQNIDAFIAWTLQMGNL